MAGTNKIQKVRILDIEIELENIFRDHYTDDSVKALVKPTIDLLIVNLKARAK